MSNLSMYQTMTTLAKRLGGPGNLAIATLAAGAVGGKLIEVVAKKAYRLVKRRRGPKSAEGAGQPSGVYTVRCAAETVAGLKLEEGNFSRFSNATRTPF